MMKSRFSAEQVEAILKQAKEGAPVMKLCEEHHMSHVTFYRWRRKAKSVAAGSPISSLTARSPDGAAAVQ